MKASNHPGPLSPTALGLSMALVACSGPDSGPPEQSVQTYEVRRGDLKVSVREKAEIQSARQVTVTSKVEGRATLIYLAPEGTMVESGEKLAQLDVSALEEKRSRQAIAVAKAEAAVEQAKKRLEIMEQDLAAERNAAEGRLKIARMERQKFLGRQARSAREGAGAEGTNGEMLARLAGLLEGDPKGRDYPDMKARVLELLGPAENRRRDLGQMATQILREIDKIRLTRAELELTLDTYNHSVQLAARQFITRNELERDKLNYERQLSAVNLAWNDLDILINYSLQQTQILLDQDEENAELNLASIIGNNESRRVREHVELKSAEAELRLARESLDNWDRQVASGTMLAPGPGLVVYAKRGNRWSQEVVEEGLEVRKGQPLIHLPDLTSMIADLKIQEADIENISLGQSAWVRADALPEHLLAGSVSKVAALPDSGPRFNDTLKVYKATVTLEDTAGLDLRPGMNASVEIIVDILHDVLSIPTSAVQRSGHTHYVWKLDRSGPVATTVQVGRNSLTLVEIVTGLAEGDVIYLVKPDGVDTPEFPEASADLGLARPLDN